MTAHRRTTATRFGRPHDRMRDAIAQALAHDVGLDNSGHGKQMIRDAGLDRRAENLEHEVELLVDELAAAAIAQSAPLRAARDQIHEAAHNHERTRLEQAVHIDGPTYGQVAA
jgi:hypothetical protein